MPRLPATSECLVLAGGLLALGAEAVRALVPLELRALYPALLERLEPGDKGDVARAWFGSPAEPRLLVVAATSDRCSRHNCAAQPHALTKLLSDALPKRGAVAIALALADPGHALAACCAVARALPRYTRKSKPAPDRTVHVAPVASVASSPTVLASLQRAADAVRRAARLVDTPPCELDTRAFVAEARAVAAEVGARCDVVSGEALRERGLGGIYHVGKAAVSPPALVVLSHGASSVVGPGPHPPVPGSLCWVGKGIVYDTGGLSLKDRVGMEGMKADMAGAAAVLCAFGAAVANGHPGPLHAVLCIAENAIGPKATRPDDIIEMYSGKTVEINNTDAEGRLVLGDGVAYARRDLGASTIIDLATLTGAQSISTGKRHAGIVSNDEGLERLAVACGRVSGDLVHPLPFAPEIFRAEFKSKVADLKNSVADRANAQSSCAAQFINEHLGDYAGRWLHVDMAGPAKSAERGTGYGVALLLELADALGREAPGAG